MVIYKSISLEKNRHDLLESCFRLEDLGISLLHLIQLSSTSLEIHFGKMNEFGTLDILPSYPTTCKDW